MVAFGEDRAMLPSEFYRGSNQGTLTSAVWPSPEGISVDLCGSVLQALTQVHSKHFGQSREDAALHGHLYMLI